MSSSAITQPPQSAEEFDAADAVFRERYGALRLRTAIVGMSGIIGWTMALFGLLMFGNPLADGLVGYSSSGAGIDIPAALFQRPESALHGLTLLFTFACLGFVGIVGALKRGLPLRDQIVWVTMLSVGACFILYTQSRVFLVAQEREKARSLMLAVRQGSVSDAESFLRDASRSESQYVLAQMALRARDEVALKTYAEPLLARVDRLLLRMDEGSYEPIPDLRIDVLRRLDLELHGAAHSQVSLSSGTAQAASSGEQRHVSDIAGVAGSLLLAGLSSAVLLLFRRMMQRLVRLCVWLGLE